MQFRSDNNDRRRILRVVAAAAPSVLFAVACLAILQGYLKIHGYQFDQLSPLKLSVLGCIAAIALYSMLSLPSRRLRRFNNLVLFNVLLTLAGAELVLHAMEDALPHAVVEMLPNDDRTRLLKDRGMFVADSISGDGMLYSWTPNAIFSSLPWLRVDSNGFRNPAVPQSADVVILGDSVTIAQNSERDMADIFRNKGISVLNLGFSGYGPSHQRDAYAKYVLTAGIGHRVVLINFCFCNDVTDAQSYDQISRRGGNWRDYLGTTPSRNAFPLDIDPPWTVSILFHLPFAAVQAWRNWRAKAENFTLELPRGRVEVGGWHLPSKSVDFRDAGWQPAIAAIADIVRRARAAGAKVVLAYYPNTAQIYLPYMPPSNPVGQAARKDYEDSLSRLRRLAHRASAAFVDYTEAMQIANASSPVTVANSDYHPNERGVEIMAETAWPAINRLLQP